MVKPDIATASAADVSAWYASPEGQADLAAALAAREARDAEIQALMVAKPRALRPLPVKPGGRVKKRFAVMYDGAKVGEIRLVQLRGRWAGSPGGIAHCWMSTPNPPLPMNSRQEAAEYVVRRHVSA